MKRKRFWFFVFGALFGIALSAGISRFDRYAREARLSVWVKNETPYEFEMELDIDKQYLHFVIPAKTAEPYSIFENKEHRVRYTFPIGALLKLENAEKGLRFRKCLNCMDDEDERILDVERDMRDGKLHLDVYVPVSFIISETETGEIIVSSRFSPVPLP